MTRTTGALKTEFPFADTSDKKLVDEAVEGMTVRGIGRTTAQPIESGRRAATRERC